MKKNQRWFLLLIVCSAIFLSVLDLFIVNVALPVIKTGIKGTDADIQFVIVMYIVGYASFLITGGRAGEYFGKKKVFLTGMLVFTIASFVCGFSQSATQLNIARFIQGISAAFMVPQGMAFIPDLFPDPKERIKVLGVYGSIAGIASVAGQFLGGLIPDLEIISQSWRLIFLINVPIGITAVVLGFKYLKELQVKIVEKFDFAGGLLLMLTLTAFIYPLIRGRELNWPMWSILMLALSVVLLLAFIYHQWLSKSLGKNPLLNIKVFKNFDFRMGLLISLFYYLVQDSYFLINTVYLQNGMGISSVHTGIYFVCQGMGYVLASMFFASRVTRYGKYVSLCGSVIMIVALVFHVIIFNSPDAPKWQIAIILFVYGIGCGTILPSLMTISLKSIPENMLGASSGIYLTLQQISVAIGVAVVGGVFFQRLDNPPVLTLFPVAYRWATLLNIGFLIIVSVLLVLTPKASKQSV
ncbi:Multidrug resistance protein Stp [Pedobacter sp. Bi36]|nr:MULTISPECIES: MFS transporter [unclassified Pedobacter]CAH0159294.1 Multidrug resistance protein Stp [Pedobacter sp. Bi126]CAH0278843.1 Multidrug resistance protein Stp [Pedobacter sp. Bi36]